MNTPKAAQDVKQPRRTDDDSPPDPVTFPFVDEWRTRHGRSALHSSDRLRGDFTAEEVHLAFRNHGAHLETALAHDATLVGSHYQLIHFDIPLVESESAYGLIFGGPAARTGFVLTMKDIRAMPRQTLSVVLECGGNGRSRQHPRYAPSVPWSGTEGFGCAQWTGTALRPLLGRMGLSSSCTEIRFTGMDSGVQGSVVHEYARSLPLSVAMDPSDSVFLAYEMNGAPLTPAHGFPLRLIVAGWYGMASVKWLSRIEAFEKPYVGYQMRAYSYTKTGADPDVKWPVTNLKVRALMIPPGTRGCLQRGWSSMFVPPSGLTVIRRFLRTGIPEFFTRKRVLYPGPHLIYGRAWAGARSIQRVSFSTDDGQSWHDVNSLGPKTGPYGWYSWMVRWDVEKTGRYVLVVRATDSAGDTQPLTADREAGDDNWTSFGMGGNVVQRVECLVVPRSKL
jgi:sulfane dehydrogenase subunit SoxC